MTISEMYDGYPTLIEAQTAEATHLFAEYAEKVERIVDRVVQEMDTETFIRALNEALGYDLSVAVEDLRAGVKETGLLRA